MKIYHTETQADYDALMVELEKQGYEWTRGVSTTIGLHYWERRKYYTCVVVRKGRTLENYTLREVARIYPHIPIQKYKAKADKKMKFTKENVYKLFTQYRKDSDHSLNDLQDEILKLDDTPEKVVVPEFVAEWINSYLDIGGTLTDMLDSLTVPYAPVADVELLRWFKKNTELMLKALVDGYEVEKEQLYQVQVNDMFFANWGDANVFPTFIIDDIIGARKQAMSWRDKEAAENVAKIVGGKIVKVDEE